VNLVAGYRQSGQPRPRLPNPKVTPARVVSGPPSLGASASAPIAGRNDARNRQGRTLSLLDVLHQGRQGETGCKSRSIPMEKLDSLVAGHIEDRLLAPERLEEVLASVLGRPAAHMPSMQS
jgi:site-specific DNA recombinase